MALTKNPFNYFDAIYCINLKRRTDRKKLAEQEFNKMGIKKRIKWFTAIETPENGAIGALLSHRKIIEIAVEKKYNNVLVFEDDVKFRVNLKKIEQIISELNKVEWDIFYFGGWFDLRYHPQKENLSKELMRVFSLMCSHSISYNSRFFNFFLKSFPASTEELKENKEFKKFGAIDLWLKDIQKSYTALSARELTATIYRTKSDIQNWGVTPFIIKKNWIIATNNILNFLNEVRKKIKHYLKK